MNRFKNILYVIEPTVDQVSAIERAVTLAENNHAKLTFIEVITPFPDDIEDDHRHYIESLIDPYRQRLNIQIEIKRGSVFLEVIRTVLRNSHDLVIKAAENPDFLKRLFGSNDIHLLRKCPCPVWIMKPPEKTNYKCIMAAVDFDPLKSIDTEIALNNNILQLSGSLALSEFASLHIVHVWEVFAKNVMRSRSGTTGEGITANIEREFLLHQNGMYILADKLREQIGADAYNYISPHFHLIRGSAQKLIAAKAVELNADIVVMGTVARTGIPGFIIGNTAEAILDQLTCSVLAVKPPGFISPVEIT